MSSELPEGWEWRQLQDVAEVRLGRQRSPKNHRGDNMVPYLRAANVTWDGLDLSDVKEMNFTSEEVETYCLHAGDIVVAEASGSASEVGKPALWSDEIDVCCIQNTLIRVRSSGPLPEFLYFVLLQAARAGRFADASLGVGINHLGATRLAKWPVALPPADEQAHIVEHLSRIHESTVGAARADLTDAEALTSVFRRAVIHAALDIDAPRVPLPEVVTIVSGQTPKGLMSVEGGDIPYYKVGDMNASNGRTMAAARSYLTEEAARELKIKVHPAGTVIFPKRGGAIATNKKRILKTPAAFDLNTMGLVPSNRILPDFLLFWLLSVDLGALSDGSQVPQINHSDIAPLTLPLPPRDHQVAIVQRVAAALAEADKLAVDLADVAQATNALWLTTLTDATQGRLHLPSRKGTASARHDGQIASYA